jgi:hypothetical protein
MTNMLKDYVVQKVGGTEACNFRSKIFSDGVRKSIL